MSEERAEAWIRDLVEIFTRKFENLPKQSSSPVEEDPEWLWGVVIPADKTQKPRVINKRYRGPWATSALNRAQRECGPDDTYTCVHGETYEDAVAEVASRRAKGYI